MLKDFGEFWGVGGGVDYGGEGEGVGGGVDKVFEQFQIAIALPTNFKQS